LNVSKYDRYLVPSGSPVLKQVCQDVAPGEDLRGLMEIMEKVCKKGSVSGAGLAAPQVGVAKKLIFLNVAIKGTVRGQFMINPRITKYGDDTEVMEEGCLSYPGIRKPIRRSTSITVEYETLRREKAVEEIHDAWRARVVQHECDHLEGVCRVGDPEYLGDLENQSTAGMTADEVSERHQTRSRKRGELAAAMLTTIASMAVSTYRPRP
jgi:peptide deformylase